MQFGNVTGSGRFAGSPPHDPGGGDIRSEGGQRAMDPYLEIKVGEGARQIGLAPSAVCRIGRSSHNDVVLDDTIASREHAIIRRDGAERCVVMDAGSRNGTRLNGRLVTAPVRLKDGDVVAIGLHEITFRDPNLPRETIRPTFTTQPTILSAQQSLVTVLVIDIRGFTPLSREIGEALISAVMTTIFREIGALLEQTHCWSQKFIGDAIMAVWKHGPPGLQATELTEALGVLSTLARLLAEVRVRFGLSQPLAFGAAINSGSAALGNMGSAAAADFTAMGDAVNLAFRLERASRSLGVDIVIGEATFKALQPPLPRELLPPAVEVTLKGYDEPQSARRLWISDLPRLVELLAD